MSDVYSKKPKDESLIALIESVVNDQADDDQRKELEQRLLTDERARDKYINYINLHSALSRRYMVNLESEPMNDSIVQDMADIHLGSSQDQLTDLAARPIISTTSVVLLLAASVLLGIGVWKFDWLNQTDSPRVVHTTTDAMVQLVDGTWEALDLNRKILAGESLQTESEGEVLLRYTDGTEIRLSGSAFLTVGGSPEHGKYLDLKSGLLNADVAKQSHNKPLIIATPHTNVRVLGTKFELTTDHDSGTQLDLQEGKVELLREEQEPVPVEPNSVAIVSSIDEPVHVVSRADVIENPDFQRTQKGVHSLAFSTDSQSVIAALDYEVFYWNLGSEPNLLQYNSKERKSARYKNQFGNLIAYEEKDPRRIVVFDTENRKEVSSFKAFDRLLKGPKSDTPQNEMFVMALPPEGNWMASRSFHGRTREFQIHDLNTNKSKDVHSPRNWISGFEASPDGLKLAYGYSSIGNDKWNSVEIASPKTGDHLMNLYVRKSFKELDMSFSADSRYLAMGFKGHLQVWDLQTEERIAMIEDVGHYLAHVAISPDGTHVAAAGPSAHIRLWNIDNPSRLTLFQAGKNIRDLVFSPDGKRIAALMNQSQMKVWNLTNQESQAEGK